MTTGMRASIDAVEPSDILPVLIVGAGPVGLTLACDLLRRGVRCRIIDLNEGPIPLHESRALVIWERTMEVFRDLGLADEVLRRGKTIHRLNLFAGREKLAGIDVTLDSNDTRYRLPVSLPQGETERVLADRLLALGGCTERQTRLIALHQEAEGVTATVVHTGYEPEEIRAAWVVGCDGARSTVRKLLVTPFEGKEYDEHFLLADVRLGWKAPEDEAQVSLRPDGGGIAAFPLPEQGCWRLIDATGLPEPEQHDDISLRFRPLFEDTGHPEAVISEVFWRSSFRIHRRIARQFRTGRCFLAGDAAHIHSPLGGQGMNTGIQDAFNLGWKLALTVRGYSGDRLLNSYEAERRGIALKVLRATDVATRGLMLHSHLVEALRNRVVEFLGTKENVLARIRSSLSELDVCYRDSPIIGSGSPRSHLPESGDRVPDVIVYQTGGKEIRLFDLLKETTHHLLIFTGMPPRGGELAAVRVTAALVQERYSAIITPWIVRGDAPDENQDRVRVLYDVEMNLHRRFTSGSPSFILIRPDGYVGYRSDGMHTSDLTTYLDRIFER